MYVEAYIGICPRVLLPILLCILFSSFNVHGKGARDYLVQSGYGDKLLRLALPTAMLL